MAVLILSGARAVSMPGSVLVLWFGIFVAAVLSACWQWIASAKPKKDTVIKAAAVIGVLSVTFVWIQDFGLCDGWLGYICWL